MLLERMEGFRIPQRAGVARTFQNIRLFGAMSVLENLIVAQHNALMRASLFSIAGLLGLPRYRKAEREAVDLALRWLEKVGLVDRADWQASSLPYGDQRRLEIARAMCIEPVLLCLDEPAAGLNPHETAALNALLRSIRDDEKIGILLIEHDMSVVMEHLRPHRRARLRPQDRRGPAGAGAQRCRGDQGLPRRGGGRGTAARGRRATWRAARAAEMLRVSGVHTFYGNIEALRGVDLEVGRGRDRHPDRRQRRRQVDAADDDLRPAAGVARAHRLRGRGHHPLADARDHRAPASRNRRKAGASFPRMSVRENLLMGATTADPRHLDEDLARVFTLFPILKQRSDQRGGTLSGGEQQMLAIGRALMSRPRLLLLDEPSLGLAPMLVKQIFRTIEDINRQQNVTVFLVEQNAYHALKLAHRAYVLVNGRVSLSGTGRRTAGQSGHPRRLSRRRALNGRWR